MLIYDSLAGPAQGLRWRSTDGAWKNFELIREATGSGTITLTMSLTGMGDVLIDQLQVIAVTPSRSVGGFRREKHYDPRHILSGPINRKKMRGLMEKQARERKGERYAPRRDDETRQR